MGCLFTLCGLVPGLAGLGFSPAIKSVVEKLFDVKKTTIKIGEIKSQSVMYCSSLNTCDSNKLNFVHASNPKWYRV